MNGTVNDEEVVIMNKPRLKVYALYFEVYPNLYCFSILAD